MAVVIDFGFEEDRSIGKLKVGMMEMEICYFLLYCYGHQRALLLTLTLSLQLGSHVQVIGDKTIRNADLGHVWASIRRVARLVDKC